MAGEMYAVSGETLTGIANAIRNKTRSDEFMTVNSMAALIENIEGVGGDSIDLIDPVAVYNNTRPSDWLSMPTPADNEIYLLFHIPDGVSSLLAFTVTCTGNYTIELGSVRDGAFVQMSSTIVASGRKYEAELFADEYGNLTSSGMKQVMVKVSGTNIKTWKPSTHRKKTSPSNFARWNIVEIACRLPSGVTIACGNSNENLALDKMRYFTCYGKNKVTSVDSMFYDCYSLTEVLLDNTVTGWAGYAISLSSCSLGHAAIVKFFDSLPTITSTKAITLTGNPGVSELTGTEKAVATGKGWTLTL